MSVPSCFFAQALRREKISQAKFLELAERVGVAQRIAQNLLVDAVHFKPRPPFVSS
jgi:hypothetical protein